MTNREELFRLAHDVGAKISSANMRVDRVEWDGRAYGDGCMLSLLDFAERARPISAAKRAAR